MTWIRRLTPSNWITIIVVIVGMISTYAVSGYQVSENRKGVVENKDAIYDNSIKIQELKSNQSADYRLIIQMLKSQNDKIEEVNKKLDKLEDRSYNSK